MSKPVVEWKPIQDLDDEPERFRDRELEALNEVWKRDKDRVGEDNRVSELNAQLAREWAIETGIIEGVYTLDRGTTQTLIERGIESAFISHQSTNRDPELVARIVQAHQGVLEGLFAFVRGERPLSTGYIKELHAALLEHQETVVVFDSFGKSFEQALQKGLYKLMPNNPMRPDGKVHEYCPPEHVASEMDRMIELYREHSKRGVSTHLEAAWLHHVFTQIHPFQDGNGRVARALASLVFIKAGYFPLVVNRDDRERYIVALEEADHGDLGPLSRLFAQIQKRSLMKAIGRAVDVAPVRSVDEALSVTRDLLVDLGRIIPKEYREAKKTAATLIARANGKLRYLTSRLTSEIAEVDSSYSFSVVVPLGGPSSAELQALSKQLSYDPNVYTFNDGIMATLQAGNLLSRIVVSCHGVGSAFRGVLVVVCYFQVQDSEPVVLSEDVFRVTYTEGTNDANRRFEGWLDSCLIAGIAEWRRSLV